MAIIYFAEEKIKMNYYQNICDEVVKMGQDPQITTEEITEKILMDMQADTIPIPIVEIVEKGFGIESLSQDLAKPLEGFILIKPGLNNRFKTNRIIRVSKNIEQRQQRFVMAHELAHYIYDGYCQDSYRDTYIADKHETEEEKKANEFAANLLMPRKQFLKMFLVALNEEVNVIKYLSDCFCVTEQAITRRVTEIMNLDKMIHFGV